MPNPLHRQPDLHARVIRPDPADRIRAQLRRAGAHPLRAEIELWVSVGGAQHPTKISFVVDSGASYSRITNRTAALFGMPVPAGPDLTVTEQTATGTAAVAVRPALVRVWWTEALDGDPFEWPLLFHMLPESAPPTTAPPLLGLGGVVAECRWTFDGTYAYETPDGTLLLQDTRI